MNEELFAIEILKLRVQDLLSQRQIIVQALVVLIGGIAGISFLSHSVLKYTLIVAGVLYVIILAKNLYSVQKILKNIYKNGRV